MTVFYQKILWLTCRHFWFLWFQFDISYGLMTLLTLSYLTLNKSNLLLIVVGIYKHFVLRFMANLMQDGHIYSSGMMKNVQSFVLFLYCYAMSIVQVSKVGSCFQGKRSSNLPQTIEYLWLNWVIVLSWVEWTRLQSRCLDWSITRLECTLFAVLDICLEGGGVEQLSY